MLIKKYFNDLTTKELYEILKARAAVFVVEQNCVYQDLDDVDYQSLHVYEKDDKDDNDRIGGYLRIYPAKEFGSDGERIPDHLHTLQMGRVLTTAERRGNGMGGVLLKAGIEAAGGMGDYHTLFIEAQCYAAGFYEREGFEVCTEEFLEDGIPHVGMRLAL